MVNEPFDKEKLIAFIHGELAPEEAKDISERLEHDEALRRDVEELRAMDASLNAFFTHETEDESDFKLSADQLDRLRTSVQKQAKRRGWLTGFAIGSLITAACAGILFLRFLDHQIHQMPSGFSTARLETPERAKTPAEPPAAPAQAAPVAEPAVSGGAPAGQIAANDVEMPAPEADAVPVEEKHEALAANEEMPVPPAAAPAPQAAAPAPEVGAGGGGGAPLMANKAKPLRPAKTATTGRFAQLTKSCAVFEEPSAGSKTVNQLTEGSRLWTETAAQGWRKVYRKTGAAYIPDDCFAPVGNDAPVAVAGRAGTKSIGDELTLNAPAASSTIAQAKSYPRQAVSPKKASRPNLAMELKDEMSAKTAAPPAAAEAADELVAESAPAKDPFYLTFLVRGESSVSGAQDPAKALSYLAEQLDGNTKCLPSSIPAKTLAEGITLKVDVKPNGTIRSIQLQPELPDSGKIAACFKTKLSEQPAALAGKGGLWSIVLRTD